MPAPPEPGPNWAEIVSALFTAVGAIVAVPAALIYLRDRKDTALKALSIIYDGADCGGRLTRVIIRYVTDDLAQHYTARVQLIGQPSAYLVTDADCGGSGAAYDPGPRVVPARGTRDLTIALAPYTHTTASERSAFIAVVDGSTTSGINLKVTVSTHPTRIRQIQKKAMISSAP